MDYKEKLLWILRVMAVLHPVERPSEAKKIITDALMQDANQDSIEVWQMIARGFDVDAIKLPTNAIDVVLTESLNPKDYFEKHKQCE